MPTPSTLRPLPILLKRLLLTPPRSLQTMTMSKKSTPLIAVDFDDVLIATNESAAKCKWPLFN